MKINSFLLAIKESQKEQLILTFQISKHLKKWPMLAKVSDGPSSDAVWSVNSYKFL